MEELLTKIVKQLYDLEVQPVLEIPEPQFGDLSSNLAMQLAKKLQRNPREIAEQIATELKKEDKISDVQVAGPGFINIHLQDSELIRQAQGLPKQVLSGQKILVEYSDPNPFKPLHAGHLYTTLVGDAIAKLIQSAGGEVVRLNYGGDVGLHVAKALWAITKNLEGGGLEKLKTIQQLPKWLGKMYAEGHLAYQSDQQSKSEIEAVNKKVYQLHRDNDQDSEFAQIYWYCRAASYDYFKELYAELEVDQFDRFIPESEVFKRGLEAVAEQLSNGVFEESEGAVIFDGQSEGLHTRVFINSAGLPTYEAKDLGLALKKWQDYHFNQSIIITANEQQQYMQVVLAAISKFQPEIARRSKHITHGLVKMKGGVKMSSRKGNVLLALDMIQAAREAAEYRGQQQANSTVLAALKYAFVKNRIGGDIIYDPEESVAMEGNSGPYLQYAYARAKSILRKNDELAEDYFALDIEADERELVRKLSHYSGVVERAARELAPHLVCNYLYQLAQQFNRFYERNQVLGDARQTERLSIVRLYAEILKNGLGLLGISAPEKM